MSNPPGLLFFFFFSHGYFIPHFCNMITMQEMLEAMESGAPFSMKVCSYDRKRKKGGEWKFYPEAVLVQKEKKKEGSRPLTRIEKLQYQLHEGEKRDPNHRKHYTRNIRVLQDGHPTGIIETIHPPLVDEFNGKTLLI